jgi:hypothetical protein
MSDRPAATFHSLDLGWLAGGLTLAIAFGLTAIRAHSESDPGPGMTPAAIIGFFVLWAGPGIVGLIGTARRRRDVILGAGIACLPMAMLAFSGVTLVLLVPGILFVYAGLRDPDPGRRAPPRTSRRRGLVTAAVAILLMGPPACSSGRPRAGSSWPMERSGTDPTWSTRSTVGESRSGPKMSWPRAARPARSHRPLESSRSPAWSWQLGLPSGWVEPNSHGAVATRGGGCGRDSLFARPGDRRPDPP